MTYPLTIKSLGGDVIIEDDIHLEKYYYEYCEEISALSNRYTVIPTFSEFKKIVSNNSFYDEKNDDKKQIHKCEN